MEIERAVAALLAEPLLEELADYYAQRTAGTGVVVRDAGPGRGKGLFATRPFRQGEAVLREAPLVAAQDAENAERTPACQRCFRVLGGEKGARDGEGGPGSGSRGGPAPEAEECSVGPPDSAFCSPACLEAAVADGLEITRGREDVVLLRAASDAWKIRAGRGEDAPAPSPAGPSPAGAPAALPAAKLERAGPAARQCVETLRAIASTNEAVGIACRAIAATCAAELRASRRAAARAGGGVGSSSTAPSASGSRQSPVPPSTPAATLESLLSAWQPFAAGLKRVWWELPICGPGVTPAERAACAADRRELCRDAADLLAALAPRLAVRLPALFDARILAALVGMVELNNLALVVPSADARDGRDDLDAARAWGAPAQRGPGEGGPAGRDSSERGSPEADGSSGAGSSEAGDSSSDASTSDEPAVEGTGFYALQSCCNHSCEPSAHAHKKPDDLDGSAVLLATRDLRPGEEITISYIDEDAPLSERADALAEYLFTCDCPKCQRAQEEDFPEVAWDPKLSNNVTVMGTLGGDPDVKVFENGQTLSTFSIAVKGAKAEAPPMWLRVEAWNTLSAPAKRLAKGQRVVVEGSLKIREWRTTAGDPRREVSIGARAIARVARGNWNGGDAAAAVAAGAGSASAWGGDGAPAAAPGGSQGAAPYIPGSSSSQGGGGGGGSGGNQASYAERQREAEQGWMSYFEAPAEWYDYRQRKARGEASPRHPDFKRREPADGRVVGATSLWIQSSPQWVQDSLRQLDQTRGS